MLHNYVHAFNGFAAMLTPAQVKAMEAQPGVTLVLRDEMRYADQEDETASVGVTEAGDDYLADRSYGGYLGEDVIVGVIDSGIWPEHPSFADDGSYSDLGIVLDETDYPACDFGNIAHNPNDAPFTCNNKLLGARQVLDTYRSLIGAEDFEFDSARDGDGHGTHTASTAAGNANVSASIYGLPLGKIAGIAPRARVIAYKGLGSLGGFTSDLAAAIDQAVADGVDVINYSIGGGAGAPGARRDRVPVRSGRRRLRGHVCRQLRLRRVHRGQPGHHAVDDDGRREYPEALLSGHDHSGQRHALHRRFHHPGVPAYCRWSTQSSPAATCACRARWTRPRLRARSCSAGAVLSGVPRKVWPSSKPAARA